MNSTGSILVCHISGENPARNLSCVLPCVRGPLFPLSLAVEGSDSAAAREETPPTPVIPAVATVTSNHLTADTTAIGEFVYAW